MSDVKQIKIIDDMKSFVDNLISEAIEYNASDIHIEPQKDKVIIKFRIDGDLYIFYDIWKDYFEALVSRIKLLASIKIDEKRLPQDWQIIFSYKWQDVDIRVSTFPTLFGEKIVLRILKKDYSLLNIESLGFLNINLKLIKKWLNHKEWLILVSWPTGSWKTTTLYAMLNYFDPKKYNISTLEDPVEYTLPGINQSQINPSIWYTFSSWLRSLLRQDPDIILVWEIRDLETAKLAMEAALTWHLVLATIHANRWIWVIERLLNFGLEPYLVASALKLIVSQRLVKKLCDCAVSTKISSEEEKIFEKYLWPIYNSIKKRNFKKPVWCQKCFNSWYKWRLWLHEVIYIDKDFSKFISSWQLNEKLFEDLMIQKWFLTLFQDWLIKVILWYTTLDKVLPYKD